MVNVLAKVHILNGINTSLFEMAKALDFEFGREDIAEEKLFGLL